SAPPRVVPDLGVSNPQQPSKSPRLSGARPDPAAMHLTTASFTSRATTVAPTADAAPQAFPLPTAYGVYAISNNRLIELDTIAASPVDPRARDLFRIVSPSRTVIGDAKLSFIAYRRDLATTMPSKASVRIAARIARSM